MKYPIIDLHCDTIMACYFDNKPLKTFTGHINTEKLIQGGSMAQAFALFIPTDGKIARDGVTLPWDLYKSMLKCWNENIDANNDCIKRAYSAADIKDNFSKGYISALLTVEDGIGVDGKIERIDEMYSDGVRMLALTWNFENSIGYPNSDDSEKHMKGLKPFGFDCIKRMNEIGMIIDVSHLSEGGFWDVIKNSTKPIVASHSCAKALCNHQRNLTDKQLKALADKGSVAGINFYGRFLGEDPDYSTIEEVVKHLVHFKDIAGIDTLALGSDFDGIESKLEWEDYSGYPKILTALEKYFTEDEIEKISYKNFLRVFEAA